ncbi:MAG: nodulation protein NfeD [Chthoniobacterales bacterium]
MNCRRWSSVVLVLLALASAGRAEKVARIKVDGPIGPATASYISRGISEAHSQGAQCLIIQLDTPGGLLDSTKVIVQELLAAPVPTVVYVAPSGASATSAGCFIALAADLAAMAPATTIGAAHPVQMGGGGAGEQKVDETMKEKLENYAISYIETIAARRNRNIEWARSAVKESASITAEKALELRVVEMVAKDMTDLLAQLDGREAGGRQLKTAGGDIIEIGPSFSERALQMLWRPEVLFILMLIAVYGIIGELSNPGAILPGVVGAIALILVLYMVAVLPVNAAGLALIALALALFVIDVFTPTHGVLTVGGVAAFLIGAIMLFDRAEPYFRLSLAYIIPATVVTALFFVFVVGSGLRAQLLPKKAGAETLLGQTVAAVTRIDATGGKVFIEGEYWNAVSDAAVEEGEPVEVTGVKGLTLTVKPKATTAS